MITVDRLQAIILESIKEDGWHIGDGVDDCAGWDEKAMSSSSAALAWTIWEVMDGERSAENEKP